MKLKITFLSITACVILKRRTLQEKNYRRDILILLLKVKINANNTDFILLVIMQNLAACSMYTCGALMEPERQILGSSSEPPRQTETAHAGELLCVVQ